MRFLIFCGLVILTVALAEYPLPKCKNGDGACLTKVANEIVQKYFSGLPELNIVPLDPLHVKEMVFQRNHSSPVNIDITFTEFDTLGFKDMKIVSLSGLNADLSGRTTVAAKIPELRFVGFYKIEGEIMGLPIVGDGASDVILKNIDFEHSFELKPVEKDGQTHANVGHDTLKINPAQVHFQFDNLYNGDKAKGDAANALLNEKENVVYQELKQTFETETAHLLKALINAVFDKYPYAKYFENKF